MTTTTASHYLMSEDGLSLAVFETLASGRVKVSTLDVYENESHTAMDVETARAAYKARLRMGWTKTIDLASWNAHVKALETEWASEYEAENEAERAYERFTERQAWDNYDAEQRAMFEGGW